jgi:GDP-L-fucose synthase
MSNRVNVYITGGSGFLGKHVSNYLQKLGVKTVALSSKDCNLLDSEHAANCLKEADVIIHLAAVVGGIQFLKNNPTASFHDNFKMGLNVVKAACTGTAKRLIMAGTTCSYDVKSPLPLKESYLDNSIPWGDAAPYGYSKLALIYIANELCKMYKKDIAHVIPANLYGPGDHFEESRSHVLGALLNKALHSHKNNLKSFDVWGDGKSTRDFVYVSDVAKAIAGMSVGDRNFKGQVYNLGSGRETKISEIALMISESFYPRLDVNYVADQTIAYSRRVVCINKAKSELGYVPSVTLKEGIKETLMSLGHITS